MRLPQQSRPYQWRYIIFLCIVCLLCIASFMLLVTYRYRALPPDDVFDWTGEFTDPARGVRQFYLNDPFLNALVAWDSQYYLSIAIGGYEDANARYLTVLSGEQMSGNYGFFPLYPLLMRPLGWLFDTLGMETIPAYTLAGLLISVVGAAVGCIALYEIARERRGRRFGMRAVFYLLIFPTSFFLITVYTEGLFIALTFSALLLMQRGKLWGAAVLAAFSVWARPVGVALMLPMAILWWRQYGALPDRPRLLLTRYSIVDGLFILLPIGALGIWYLLLGAQHTQIQTEILGRSLLNISDSIRGWGGVILRVTGIVAALPETRVYGTVELITIMITIGACLAAIRFSRLIALYSLVVLTLMLFSGGAFSLTRYVLPIPALYLGLASWGRRTTFDRVWTVISLLLLGMLATLFAFNYWVA
jgi:hypothetical protein